VYCPSCACELPAVAKFCVRCGTLTGFVATTTATRPYVSDTVGSAPFGTPDHTGEAAYCGKCGTKAVGGNQFCTRCGNSLNTDDAPGSPSPFTYSPFEARESGFTPAQSDVHQSSETSPVEKNIGATNVPPRTPPGQDMVLAPLTEPAFTVGSRFVGTAGITEINPPVVRFVLLALGTMRSISVIAFGVADDIARSGLSIWIPLLVAIFVLPFLLYHAGKTLGSLKRLSFANEAVGQARIRLLRQSIVFGVLFLAIASAVGYAIGTSGNETLRLIADEDRYTKIGDRISEQRNSAANTLAGQIAMYDKLEPDVRTFAAICATLHEELTVYDEKFPGQHQTTGASLHHIDNGAKRAALLLQQIEVARRIAPLNEPQQWIVWKSDMQPLLDQENALN
jgi:hypothetical protein